MSWFDVAASIFDQVGAAGKVSRQSTADFAAGKLTAPRPRHSTLALDKIVATGFHPVDGATALADYLRSRP